MTWLIICLELKTYKKTACTLTLSLMKRHAQCHDTNCFLFLIFRCIISLVICMPLEDKQREGGGGSPGGGGGAGRGT